MSSGTYNRKRVWLGGGLVLVLAILTIGWFLVISPVLTETASTRDQIASVELQNSVLAGKNAALKADSDDVATLRESLAAALAELPTDGGLPTFTRQLSAQATAHSVVLTSVVVGAATAAAPVVAAPAGAGTTDGTTAPDGTTVADGSTDGTTGTAGTGTSAGGLMQVTVAVTASGLGRDLAGFLSDVQLVGPRRALVTTTQLAPSDGTAAIGPDAPSTLNLNLTVFSAPMTDDEQAELQKLLSGS